MSSRALPARCAAISILARILGGDRCWLVWTGVLVLLASLAGCSWVPRTVTLQPEVSEPAIQARMLVPADATVQLGETVVPAKGPAPKSDGNRPDRHDDSDVNDKTNATVHVHLSKGDYRGFPTDRQETHRESAAPASSIPDKIPAAESTEEVPTFSLSEALAFAEENNPRLRAAREALARAGGEEQAAFAPFLPEVDFFYRYVDFASEVQPTSQVLPAVVGFGSGSRAFGQGELQLQWTLWDFGRTAGRHGQAVSREDMAALQLFRAKQTIAYDVAHAYLRVLFARAARSVQEQSLRRAEAILKDTRARREGGVADLDNVLRAQVQLSETQEALVAARQAEFDSLARLNLAMGRNVCLPLKVIDMTVQPRFELSLPACLEIAAAERREVEIARQAVAVAAYGLEAAQAAFRPRIYVKGVLARIDGTGVEAGNVEGAGIHFNQQLFAGYRRQGERRSAQADVRAAAAKAQVIFDNITLEVNLAFRDIAATRQRIELAKTSTAQARENLRLVTVKYQNGNATPTDIVDAETALTRSQQRLYSAAYDYLIALARLDYVLGRAQGNLVPLSEKEAPEETAPEESPKPRVLPNR